MTDDFIDTKKMMKGMMGTVGVGVTMGVGSMAVGGMASSTTDPTTITALNSINTGIGRGANFIPVMMGASAMNAINVNYGQKKKKKAKKR